MGSAISVPNPSAGIASDPLLSGSSVWRRPSGSTIVLSLRQFQLDFSPRRLKKWWAGTGLNRRHQDFQDSYDPLCFADLPAGCAFLVPSAVSVAIFMSSFRLYSGERWA